MTEETTVTEETKKTRKPRKPSLARELEKAAEQLQLCHDREARLEQRLSEAKQKTDLSAAVVEDLKKDFLSKVGLESEEELAAE